MADLSTQYLGLELKNPIVVGSCSLTGTLDSILELEKAGAGAIVLKSVFEEEILLEAEKSQWLHPGLSETMDYIDVHVKEKRLGNYLKLISDAKKKTSIPIIASINCLSDSEWMYFAKKIQDAGADALELNVFVNPTDAEEKASEKALQNIMAKVLKAVSIPVALKLGNCYANLVQKIQRLSKSGISGLVLFNKQYLPDVNIYNCSLRSGRILSTSDEYRIPLRWIALLSGKAQCDLAASTGIYDGNTAIKQILVGAKVVQVVSALYVNGIPHIQSMLDEITQWKSKQGFFSIDQFRGIAVKESLYDSAVYERIEFMKNNGRIG